ncbi:hypothetical protein L2E82_45828 [Cichorium intybus]|uniref:Uncharacterized protein n=1 Tax=Cichorium intybus TaxID=13427 RepID=A0ACB8ZU39_CICIN|nr:hypothetical protein L2E82_45828 [Cichorium intybus]
MVLNMNFRADRNPSTARAIHDCRDGGTSSPRILTLNSDDIKELDKLGADVKSMVQNIAAFRDTLPDWLKNTVSSIIVVQRTAILTSIDDDSDHGPDTLFLKKACIKNQEGNRCINSKTLHIGPGDVARVNGHLAVSCAFGDKNLKTHLRSDPNVRNADVDANTKFLILVSDDL